MPPSFPSKRRLLLVDDDPTNLALMNAFFDPERYETQTAQDGQEALEQILEHSPDYFSAVILDYHMPRKDGITLLKELKSSDQYHTIPVVLQTSANRTEDIQRGLEAGAFYYLLKPFKKGQLTSIVDAAIQSHHHLSINAQAPLVTHTCELMEQARFRFQTLEQARYLSSMIALQTPEPQKISLGLFELMLNAIEHGNLGIGYEEKSRLISQERLQSEIGRRLSLPENRHKSVQLEWQRKNQQLEVSITDMGKGFDYTPYLDFSITRMTDAHGRGIMLANQLCFDRLSFSENGRKVTCVINLNSKASTQVH